MSQDEEAGNQCPSRPLVLPETFDGEKDLDEWISHFEDVADLNGWSDNDNYAGLRLGLLVRPTWRSID